MKNVTCQACGSQWPRDSEDKYCCICGKRLPHVLVEVHHFELFVDHPVGSEVILSLTNVHITSVVIKGIEQTINDRPVTWLVPDGAFEEIILDAGENTLLGFHYRPEEVPDTNDVLRLTLSVISQAGGHENTDSAQLRILPRPTIYPQVVRLERSGKGLGPRTYVARYNLNPIARDLFHSATPVESYRWCSRSSYHIEHDVLELSIEVDEDGIDEPNSEVTAKWLIAFGGDRPGITAELVLAPPPVIFMTTETETAAETEIVAYAGQVLWRSLAVKNVSGESQTLVKAEVEVEPYNPEVAPDPPAIQVFVREGAIVRPDQIRGREGDIRIRIDGRLIPAGSYKVGLSCSLQGKATLCETRLFVRIEELPIDSGVIAIDFGTSNSCCWHMDKDSDTGRVILLEESITIPHDEGRHYDYVSQYIPSSLGLRGPDEWLIGIDAEEQVPMHQKSLKLKLGNDEKIMNGYCARELAFFYIREILWRAERYLEKRAGFLVLSHPTRFSHRQIDDYRWIAEQLKGLYGKPPLKTVFIDEASAGALDFILGKRKDSTQFTLFVFDFGGGTVDMSLFEVVSTHRGKTEVRLLNMGGHRKLGGNDLDVVVMELAVDAFKDAVVEEEGGKTTKDRIQVPYLPEHARKNRIAHPDEPDALEVNMGFFPREAEKIKKNLCTLEGDQSSGSPLAAEIKETRDEIRTVTSTGGITVTQSQFEARAIEKLGEALETMRFVAIPVLRKDAYGIGPTPGYVYLTGQSSRMVHPDLQGLVSKALGHATEIERPSNLDRYKTCVAVGACSYGRQKLWGVDKVKTIDLFEGRARSSVGYLELDDDLNAVFVSVMAKGDDLGESVSMTRPVKDVSLFTVLENFGLNNRVQGNLDIETICECHIDRDNFDSLPEALWERSELVLTVHGDGNTRVEIVVPAGDGGSPSRLFELYPSRKASTADE